MSVRYIWAAAIGTVLLLQTVSCKKETINPPNNNTGNDTLPVSLLNDNSGFTQFYDDLIPLSDVSGSFSLPSVGVCDYTIDADNNLHLVYYSEQPTQQDAFRTYYRISKNTLSSALVGLPSGADDLNTSTQIVGNKSYGLMQFRPYTNYFTYATLTTASSWPYNNSVLYEGDIYCAISSANPVGQLDMGFTYPCLNPLATAGDNAFGYFTSGAPNPNYLLSSNNPYLFTFLNNSAQHIPVSFLESKLAGTNSCVAIIVRPDSAIAYSVDNSFVRSGILSAVTPTGMVGGNNYKSVRHYSADGTVLGMLVLDENSNLVWTYSFNFVTKQLTKHLDAVTLNYTGTGSDIDVDENGNVYYTGYASNGTNTNGVSIYKKDANGGVSLVGSDNILKYGEVVKLKVFNGKIYFAVTGRKTGTSSYQVSIVKQN